jgi:hypothetical protein
MADSIIQKDSSKCFICHSRQWLEWHHVFGGALRPKSERLGLKVRLCHYCHNEPPRGVHQNREIRLKLQSFAQKKAMKHYEWSVEDFRREFYKNYILEDKP